MLGDKTQTLNMNTARFSKKEPDSSSLLNPEANDLNKLVQHLAKQKIDMELKAKEIEQELGSKDITKKQRELLENSLKNLRKNARSDQYQEYLKERILKEI